MSSIANVTPPVLKPSFLPKQIELSHFVRPNRILSIDTLRGFDMFWIVGGEEIMHALHRFLPKIFTGRFAQQFEHVEWSGFAFYDLIFPLFVFLVGTSLVFSLSRSVETSGVWATLIKVFRRSLILFVLGVIYNGGWAGPYGTGPRLMGVLQRIAFSYCCASVLYCYFRPRGLVLWCAGLLGFYWALLTFAPMTEGAERFSEADNFAGWIDGQFLPYVKHKQKFYDPEGLLSAIPAISTCLLGVLAGTILQNSTWSARRKLWWMLLAGAGLLLAGWGWSFQFPIIKKIWTSSFVLFAGGASYCLLAGFYFLIDVRGWQRWAIPFVWIGTNAISIYLLTALLNFQHLAERLAGGAFSQWISRLLGNGAGELLVSIVAIGLVLAVCRFLYQRKIFLKI